MGISILQGSSANKFSMGIMLVGESDFPLREEALKLYWASILPAKSD